MRPLNTFCLLVLISTIGFAQSSIEQIEKIQKQTKAIDEFAWTADFRSIQFQDENGQELELLIYTDNDRPIKLSIVGKNETSKEQKIFYFDEQGLIHVISSQTTYKRAPRWEEAKSNELGEAEFRDANTVKIKKGYFYFENWKLIEWVSDARKYDSYEKTEMELINEARGLLRKLK